MTRMMSASSSIPTRSLLVSFFAVYCYCSACCSVLVVMGFSASAAPSSHDVKSSSSSNNNHSSHDVKSSSNNNNHEQSMAQYLVDMSDAKETLDFCGGMMFQLVITDALKDHLLSASFQQNDADDDDDTDTAKEDVMVYQQTPRMHLTPEYQRSSAADNIKYFHGREIRNVPDAAGGMGMVLQLSLAPVSTTTATTATTRTRTKKQEEVDPEGWTPQEIARYDGWGHDSSREWRQGEQLVDEGYTTFREKYGPKAYALHHRFYFHQQASGLLPGSTPVLWLAAEDGCQGTPATNGNTTILSKLVGLFQ